MSGLVATEGLLLVGHGTRSERGRAEVAQLGRLVAQRAPAVAVEVGFLELCEPAADLAIGRLIDRGVDRVGVVPLMLNAAGHAKSDVPAIVVEARRRHPGVSFGYGRPLGVDHALLTLAGQRIAATGAGAPLLLVGRGTTDPDANSEAWKVARLLSEMVQAPFAQVAYAGLTDPRVPEGLERCRRLGATEIVVFSWLLAAGALVDRVVEQCADFEEVTGVRVRHAGYLGPDPALADLVVERHHEALHGDVRQNCDTCAYRKPFPGLEDRIGQPVGVGHSHLALAHRHAH